MAKFGDESNNKVPGPAVQEQVRRLSRVAGQVNGIARMVVEGRAPVDIITQLKAVRSALDVVEDKLLRRVVSEGIQKALELPDRASQTSALDALFEIQSRGSLRPKRASPGLDGSIDNF